MGPPSTTLHEATRGGLLGVQAPPDQYGAERVVSSVSAALASFWGKCLLIPLAYFPVWLFLMIFFGNVSSTLVSCRACLPALPAVKVALAHIVVPVDSSHVWQRVPLQPCEVVGPRPGVAHEQRPAVLWDWHVPTLEAPRCWGPAGSPSGGTGQRSSGLLCLHLWESCQVHVPLSWSGRAQSSAFPTGAQVPPWCETGAGRAGVEAAQKGLLINGRWAHGSKCAVGVGGLQDFSLSN